MPNLAKKRYLIRFEFSGTNFYGSQKQPDKRTVQGEIETALRTLTKDNSISIIISGRTDAKVSAKFQSAHFDFENIGNIEKFKYSINSILPDDLKILELKEVKPDFHAQKDAKYKHYRYTILNDHVASVFRSHYLYYPYFKLDIEKINKILSILKGHHDFSAFKSKSDNPYNDCVIYYAEARKEIIEKREYVFIDIIGNRFLYNMIRTIVGDILSILKNDYNHKIIKEMLETGIRKTTHHVVSGEGLCLEYVGYGNVENYVKNLIGR